MGNTNRTEAAFETVLCGSLLAGGYENIDRDGFDRERAIFPEVVLGFIRETQAKQWEKLEALHGDSFLRQVIPYQDSDLEKLYTYLRHLAAKLPRRRSGPQYSFDDDVRLEYYLRFPAGGIQQ